jgi:hypothetical protein
MKTSKSRLLKLKTNLGRSLLYIAAIAFYLAASTAQASFLGDIKRRLQAALGSSYPCACLQPCPCAGETDVRKSNPCTCAGICQCDYGGGVIAQPNIPGAGTA